MLENLFTYLVTDGFFIYYMWSIFIILYGLIFMNCLYSGLYNQYNSLYLSQLCRDFYFYKKVQMGA